MKPAVEFLEAAIYLALNEHDLALQQHEAEFFAGHGLPHERTQLSKIVPAMRLHLSNLTGHYHQAAKLHENASPTALVSFNPAAFDELLAA